jgi:predicted 3-demethylubiquinone-9 3-methyltransferase (glyoxalase superfamily)
MVVRYRLGDHEFTALNGGPHYQLNSAVSFTIDCKSQEEVDYYWDAFMDGGTPQACGWIVDRFGVTWQVTPSRLIELMRDPDPEKANRVVQAMLQMIKLDIPTLEAAYRGE